MREIKFRMWDTLTNKYFTDQDEVMECLKQQVSGFHNHEANGSVFEQYTGLKDKNGVEIYEGDVVTVNGNPYFVEWRGAGLWFIDPDNDTCSMFTPEIYKLEVVGNIHDNPELLKELV